MDVTNTVECIHARLAEMGRRLAHHVPTLLEHAQAIWREEHVVIGIAVVGVIGDEQLLTCAYGAHDSSKVLRPLWDRLEQDAVLHILRLVERGLESEGRDDITAHVSPLMQIILTIDVIIVPATVAADIDTEENEYILLIAVELTSREGLFAILVDGRVRPTTINILLAKMAGGNSVDKSNIHLEDLSGRHRELRINYLPFAIRGFGELFSGECEGVEFHLVQHGSESVAACGG